MGASHRPPAVLHDLLRAAVLAVLYLSAVRLQLSSAPPPSTFISRLLCMNFRPVSTKTAFFLANALILAIVRLSTGRRGHPPAPMQPQPFRDDALVREAHPEDDLFHMPPLEGDVPYEDETAPTDSFLATSHAPADATWEPQRGRLSQPSRRRRRRQFTARATSAGEELWEMPLRPSEPDVGTGWNTPVDHLPRPSRWRRQLATQMASATKDPWEMPFWQSDPYVGTSCNTPAGHLFWPSRRRRQLVARVSSAGEESGERPLQWSNPDVGTSWNTPVSRHSKQSRQRRQPADRAPSPVGERRLRCSDPDMGTSSNTSVEGEAKVKDECKEKFDAFIGRQNRFMGREEFLVASSLASGAMVAAGGP